MSNLRFVIGERIRNFRNERKLSQEELADLANIHRTYVGQLERGEKNVTLGTIEKVTEALGVSLEDLFRFIHTATEDQDNFTLHQIINRLQGRSLEDQKTVLRLLDLILDWKGESK
jgi:transcriptional regulator with XRE-family HTH domain